MSSDNFVAIFEQMSGEYDVEEMNSEGDKIGDIGHFMTLRHAMIDAEEYQKENEVEYGIRFYPYPRKTDIL